MPGKKKTTPKAAKQKSETPAPAPEEVKAAADPNAGKQKVWMACRYNGGCGGNEAIMVFSRAQIASPNNLAMGGNITRYRCLKCNGAWHVTT